jgi:hypothetical protein
VIRSCVLAVFLACLLATPASADRWPASTVQRAIAVADSHWPGSPCYGQHQITWLTGAELDATGLGVHLWGYGDTDECRVWVAWDRVDPVGVYRPGVYLCEVLEHEFGHTAGLSHSDNPDDVMYAEGPARPPRECVAAFRRLRYVPSFSRWHVERNHRGTGLAL